MSEEVLELKIENIKLKESSGLTELPPSIEVKLQKSNTSASARAKESRGLSEPPFSIEVRSQKSDTSTRVKAKELPGLSGAPPPIEDRLGSADGSEPPIPPAQEEQSERRQVTDKAHRGAPKSRMREERSTEKRTPVYKSNPAYLGMKKVLKDTNLSKRKYKMAKKQLQEDCERLMN